MPKFQIRGVPTIGMELWLDEQRCVAVKVAPYLRKDGGHSWLLTWRIECADCGAPFEAQSGTAGNIPVRRCTPCRTPHTIRPVGQRGYPVNVKIVRPNPTQAPNHD